MSATINPPLTILRLRRVKHRTGLSRSNIYAKIAAGDFPASIALGPRAVGWLASEIENWIASRVKTGRKGAL